MAKIQIKSEKLTPFGGIFSIMEQFDALLLDEEGHPSLFAPIMIATLSTCAQLERDNISFRLQSGSGI